MINTRFFSSRRDFEQWFEEQYQGKGLQPDDLSYRFAFYTLLPFFKEGLFAVSFAKPFRVGNQQFIIDTVDFYPYAGLLPDLHRYLRRKETVLYVDFTAQADSGLVVLTALKNGSLTTFVVGRRQYASFLKKYAGWKIVEIRDVSDYDESRICRFIEIDEAASVRLKQHFLLFLAVLLLGTSFFFLGKGFMAQGRIYSHYGHTERIKAEILGLRTALEKERKRIAYLGVKEHVLRERELKDILRALPVWVEVAGAGQTANIVSFVKSLRKRNVQGIVIPSRFRFLYPQIKKKLPGALLTAQGIFIPLETKISP